MVNRPHPLFGFVFLIVFAGILAAFTVEAKEPVWALRSEWVYRAEVGAAVTGLLYLPLVTLSLAWRGDTFRKMKLPGGPVLEAPAEVATAAGRFEEFKKQSDGHLQRIETALDNLNQRVERLETGDD